MVRESCDCSSTRGRILKSDQRPVPESDGGDSKRAKGDLAIVSHGAMLAYVVEYLMRNDPNDQEIIVGNASITTIRYEQESGRAVLIQANDQTHLAELTS